MPDLSWFMVTGQAKGIQGSIRAKARERALQEPCQHHCVVGEILEGMDLLEQQDPKPRTHLLRRFATAVSDANFEM